MYYPHMDACRRSRRKLSHTTADGRSSGEWEKDAGGCGVRALQVITDSDPSARAPREERWRERGIEGGGERGKGIEGRRARRI